MSTATLDPPRVAPSPPSGDLPPLPKTIGPEHNGLAMSGREWDAHEDWAEGYTYELVEGTLIVCPAPSAGERKPNGKLEQLIANYIDAHPDGPVKETLAEQYIVVGPNRRRRCDRAIWLGEVPENPDETAPDIAIEIVSGSRRDRERDYVVKRGEYAAAGVKEYWVFDRFARTVTAFRGGGETRFGEDAAVTSPLMPGFSLPVAEILKAADRYA